MKIKYGGTRIIFVFHNFVVKIPRRIHLRYPLRYIFMTQEERKKKLEFKNFKEALKYIFGGIYANYLEHNYSKQHNDSPAIMQSYGLFFGIIIIQRKGEVLADNDPRWLKVYRLIKRFGFKEIDSLRSCNFCIWNNSIRMLDYGREETIDALNTNTQILKHFGVLNS